MLRTINLSESTVPWYHQWKLIDSATPCPDLFSKHVLF